LHSFFTYIYIGHKNKLKSGEASGEGCVFLYIWSLSISHRKGIIQSNKESRSSSVVVPVDYCAVRDPCEFFNHTTYTNVQNGSVLAPACLIVSSWHSRSSEELINRRTGYQERKNWHHPFGRDPAQGQGSSRMARWRRYWRWSGRRHGRITKRENV